MAECIHVDPYKHLELVLLVSHRDELSEARASAYQHVTRSCLDIAP